MDSSSRPRLDALTGLRYVAALTVLLAHMGHNMPLNEKDKLFVVVLSAIGMPLFFVLSGFLMAYNYSTGFRDRFGRTLRSYYVARFARIYPVYAVSLLLYLSVTGCFFNDLKDHPDDTRKSLRYVSTLTQSWAHAPVFQGTHNPRPVSQAYMGVAWSVSTEAFFYLVFPLVVLPLARFVTGRGRMLAGAAAVYLAYLVAGYLIFNAIPPEVREGPDWGNSRGWWMIYLCPYMRFGEFLIGAFVGQYFLRTADRPAPTGRRWWAGAGLLAAAVVLFVGGNYRLLLPHEFGAGPTPRWVIMAAMNVLYAPLAAVVILQLAAFPSLAQRAMGCRLMVLLGEMSYCMYLLHPLAQTFYHGRAVGEGPLKTWYVVLYNNLALVAVLHLMCLGMYRYIELPARTAIRNLLDPKPKRTLQVVPADAPAKRAA
jgi:peptidoglycan/LPS O-acetylase OafA/YrhL